MKKKRIAIIVPFLDVGGTENMVAQLTTHLDKDRFDVLLIVLGPQKITHIQQYVTSYGITPVYLDKSAGFNYKVLLRMYKVLNRYKPDLIHTHLYAFAYASPWIFLHNVKMLHTVHNPPQHELSAKSRKVIATLYRSNKAVPVAISTIIAEKMTSFYKLKHIETIYNPVDLDRFKTVRRHEQDKPVTFVTIGRLTDQKNHDLMFHSFALVTAELPDARLKMVGDGELKEDLLRLADELQIRHCVDFLGNIKETEVELANSDIFVLSSDYEGLPLTVLEAMASGLPIVSTAVGGVPDIVTDNGILVEPNNRAALAEAMIELARNQECRKEMGEKSLRNVQPFDVALVTKRYENLYSKYVKS